MKTALQQESNLANDGGKSSHAYVTPEVNISETTDGYILTAEMPGVSKSRLEVTLEGTELTLIGHREAGTPKAQLLFRESRQADYRRVFELNPSIDAAKITAQMDQGVLTLHLPKVARVKPFRIEVTE